MPDPNDDVRLRNLKHAAVRLVDTKLALKLAGASPLAARLDEHAETIRTLIAMRKHELGIKE